MRILAERLQRVCPCGNIFYKTLKRAADTRRGKYCSRDCYYKYRKPVPGFPKGSKRPPFSAEWKRNIALSRIGKTPWNKGKPWPDEIKEKLSGPRDRLVGAGNPNWKGGIDQLIRGIRRSREYKRFKMFIRKRDKVCVLCGSSVRLHVDHMKSFTYFPELRFEPSNGRLLCFECHKKTPNFGSKARKGAVQGI